MEDPFLGFYRSFLLPGVALPGTRFRKVFVEKFLGVLITLSRCQVQSHIRNNQIFGHTGGKRVDVTNCHPTSAFGHPATLTLPRRVRAHHRALAPCRFRGGGLGPRNHQPRAGRVYRIDRPPCLTNPRPQGFSLSPVFQLHAPAEPRQLLRPWIFIQ